MDSENINKFKDTINLFILMSLKNIVGEEQWLKIKDYIQYKGTEIGREMINKTEG